MHAAYTVGKNFALFNLMATKCMLALLVPGVAAVLPGPGPNKLARTRECWPAGCPPATSASRCLL